MQIVLRTESAEAELDVTVDARVPAGATLGDLVARVTGRSPPATVRVDDRPLPSSTPVSYTHLTLPTKA